jgi:hypothetical protein
MPHCVSRPGLLLSTVFLAACVPQGTVADGGNDNPLPTGAAGASGNGAAGSVGTGGTVGGAGSGGSGNVGRGGAAGGVSPSGSAGVTGNAGAAGGVSGTAGSGVAGSNAGRPGCALAAAAFCDTLATPSPGGRGGDLDDAKWSVTRITNIFNVGQGNWITYPLATGLICGKTVSGIMPPNDYKVCTDSNGPHLTQTADDGGGNIVSSFRARQPFDFTGRTGVIAFDLGGRQSGGHGFWPEIIITSDPSPAPYQDLIGIFPYPRNAIGVELANQPTCQHRMPLDYTSNGVSAIKVIRDYVVSGWGGNDLQADYSGTGKLSQPPCFPVNNERMSHYELRISANTIELWVTDPGADAKALRLVAKKDGIRLPFTRGYVNFQQAAYNAGKDDQAGHPKEHTFNWANVGFDGPVLPVERGYDVPDALTLFRDGSPNVGYHINASQPLSFPLAGVDLGGAAAASLHLNVYGFYTGRILQFRFNGGAWQDFVSDLPPNLEQRSLHIPVPLALLRAGDNLLDIRAGGAYDLGGANFDLTIR